MIKELKNMEYLNFVITENNEVINPRLDVESGGLVIHKAATLQEAKDFIWGLKMKGFIKIPNCL